MVSLPDPSPEWPPDFSGGADAPLSALLRRARWPRRQGQSARLVALAVVAAGALPPVGLAALPGGLSMLGAPRSGVVLIAALLFAPALVGFAVALQGLDAVIARLRAAVGGEHRQIIARVLLGALILGYVFGLLGALPQDPAIGPALLIGSLNLAAAWLFLLNIVLEPRPSAVRRTAALISDVALLSILLAAGGGLTAALVLVYLYIAIVNGEHHGPRALALTIGLEVAAFAVVIALTPFWRDRLLPAAGLLGAMVLLPAYVGAVLHRLGTAKTRAERANNAKNRFLASLSDDLRGPLRSIARAGGALDRAALDPALWDMIARTRLSARAMLLQLDDMLNYVKIDDGSFAPETRSFDLHRLAGGAVAALRAPAAERGITLALRIDPTLPYQLRGWPHQFRQVLTCLLTNAIRQVDKARLRVNFDAVGLDDDRLTLRLVVASGAGDRRLETADEAAIEADDDSRHLGLAVADRLVGLMGGRLAAESDPRRGLSLSVELPFAVDRASLALPLDLANLPVLIVTKDAAFVGDLIEPLEAWRADPRWIGAGDAALLYLDGFEGGRRPVLVVDGRGDVLQALSWAHRATALPLNDPPYVLFIADEPRIDSVIGLADGELDGILPAPFTHAALRGALHALRVEPADWFLTDLPPASDEPAAPRPRRVVREVAPLHPPAPPPAMAAEPPPAPPVRPPPSASEPAPPPAAAEPLRFVRPPPPEPPPRASPRTPPAAPAARPRQVLVATANPANRKILGSILARAGHVVQFAEDADDARQGLETRHVDALVLDLTGYAGADYGAARQCRKARPTLPIIALSADSPDIAERRARAAGLDAVLPKPLEPRRLVAAIATALEPADLPTAEPAPRGVVTELASHPRFGGETAGSGENLDVATLSEEGEALRSLIDNFRTESVHLVTAIDQAAGAGDVRAFEEAVQAMHACTAVFGVARMGEILGMIREPTPAKLRLQGADFVHRLESELARLDAALVDYLKTAK